MNQYKRLLSDTIIYGVTSILGRIIFVLLSKLYTNVDVLSQAEVGVQGIVYSLIAFMMVFFGYGLETAFFRYALKDKESSLERTLSTALFSVLTTSITLGGVCLLFHRQLAQLIQIHGYEPILALAILIVVFDTLTSIPFAYLRATNRPIKFAAIKLLGILISVGLNIFFLWYCPKVVQTGEQHSLYQFVTSFYDPTYHLRYAFLANVIDAGVKLLLLLPIYRKMRIGFAPKLWKQMITYGAPIMLVLIGSMINEVGDRTLLNWLLPGSEGGVKREIGIYSSAYKLSIFLALFTQAFRYAGEPFFFSKAKNKNAPETYANVFNYFTIFTLFGFLFVGLNIHLLKHIIIHSKEYYQGLFIVPVLLMAYVFSGIYYNLSIWYKLSDRTIYGAVVALVGAIVTIGVNLLFIPKYGYVASAWATFLCFFTMSIIAYIWGQKEYPVPYDLKRLAIYLTSSVVIYFVFQQFASQFDEYSLVRIAIQLSALVVFAGIVYALERKKLVRVLKGNE